MSSLRQLKSDLAQAKMPSFELPTCQSCWLGWICAGVGLGDSAGPLQTPVRCTHGSSILWKMLTHSLSYPLLNSARQQLFGTLE